MTVTLQIQLGFCSITVITPEALSGSVFSPSPHYAIGLQEFNVTAEAIVADPTDGCEIYNNVTGKIVVVIMDDTLCLADIIMNAVLEANGLVRHKTRGELLFTNYFQAVILHYDGISSLDTFTFSRALTERIPIGAVALSNDVRVFQQLFKNPTNRRHFVQHWDILLPYLNGTGEVVTLTVTSGGMKSILI